MEPFGTYRSSTCLVAGIPVVVVSLRLKCHFTIINYVVCVCPMRTALKFNKQIVNMREGGGTSLNFIYFWSKQNSAKRYLYFE